MLKVVYRDDSQVVRLEVQKVYADDGRVGARITVAPVTALLFQLPCGCGRPVRQLTDDSPMTLMEATKWNRAAYCAECFDALPEDVTDY